MTEAKEDVRWCVVKEMAKFVKGGWGGRMEDLQIYAVQINDLLFDLFFFFGWHHGDSRRVYRGAVYLSRRVRKPEYLQHHRAFKYLWLTGLRTGSVRGQLESVWPKQQKIEIAWEIEELCDKNTRPYVFYRAPETDCRLTWLQHSAQWNIPVCERMRNTDSKMSSGLVLRRFPSDMAAEPISPSYLCFQPAAPRESDRGESRQ